MEHPPESVPPTDDGDDGLKELIVRLAAENLRLHEAAAAQVRRLEDKVDALAATRAPAPAPAAAAGESSEAAAPEPDDDDVALAQVLAKVRVLHGLVEESRGAGDAALTRALEAKLAQVQQRGPADEPEAAARAAADAGESDAERAAAPQQGVATAELDMADAERVVIVMSCPEMGTLDPFGSPPFDQAVMIKVADMQQRGILKMGFDRAGSTTSVPEDAVLFERALAAGRAGREAEAKKLIRMTKWFYGYCTAAKAQVKLFSQETFGLLEIICVEGGMITQVEAEEMGNIIRQAKKDARLSGVKCRFKLTEMPYYDFLEQFDSGVVRPSRFRLCLPVNVLL